MTEQMFTPGDADFSMWSDTAGEVTAQRTASMVSLAQAAVEPLWPYLSAATTRVEFEHRMGMVEDGIASRVAAVIGYDPSGVGEARKHLLDRWAAVEVDRTANVLRTAGLGHMLAGDGQTAEVMAFPQCDICQQKEAAYDGKTTMGPWAYMCEGCFKDNGLGTGLGVGQKLVLAPSSKTSAAVVHKAVSASIGKDLYCGADSGPDSWEWDDVTCPACLSKKTTAAVTSASSLHTAWVDAQSGAATWWCPNCLYEFANNADANHAPTCPKCGSVGADNSDPSKTSGLHEAKHPGAQGYATKCPRCGSATKDKPLGWVDFSECPKCHWVGHRSEGITGGLHEAKNQLKAECQKCGHPVVREVQDTGWRHDDSVDGWARPTVLNHEARPKPGTMRKATLHTAETNPPYYIEEKDGKFVVVNDEGAVKGTFDTKEQARQQQKALYANVPGASEEAEKQHGQPKPKVQSAVQALLQSEAGFRDFMNEVTGRGTCKHCGTDIVTHGGKYWEAASGEPGSDLCRANKGTKTKQGGEHQPAKTSAVAALLISEGFMVEAVDAKCDNCGKTVNRHDAYVRGGLVGNDWGQTVYCKDCAKDKGFTKAAEIEEQPTNSWDCKRCGNRVDRYRGMYDVTCPHCGAEYNASGQQLRDDWRGNPSNYDDEIGDMEGYEDSFHDSSLRQGADHHRLSPGSGLTCASCGHVDQVHSGKWCQNCADAKSAEDPKHAFVPRGKKAVNESAQGTERYQHVETPGRPSWITEWADAEMKATKEMTEQGLNAYVPPNPFPNLTTLQQVRSLALKQATDEEDEDHGVSNRIGCEICGATPSYFNYHAGLKPEHRDGGYDAFHAPPGGWDNEASPMGWFCEQHYPGGLSDYQKPKGQTFPPLFSRRTAKVDLKPDWEGSQYCSYGDAPHSEKTYVVKSDGQYGGGVCEKHAKEKGWLPWSKDSVRRTAADDEGFNTGDTEPDAGFTEVGEVPMVDENAATGDSQPKTTKPAQVPGQNDAPHMVTLDTQIIPPDPMPGMGQGQAEPQMGSGGGFDMGYAPTNDPMLPTTEQMVAAKVARLTERIELDNPSMDRTEARRLAALTVAKHPEMVKAQR